MLQRLAVLNDLVSKFVHRLGPGILAQELPVKTEYVMAVGWVGLTGGGRNQPINGWHHTTNQWDTAKLIFQLYRVVLTVKLSPFQLKLYRQLLDYMLAKNLQKSSNSVVLEMANLGIFHFSFHYSFCFSILAL